MTRISTLVSALAFALALVPASALVAAPAPGGGHPPPMAKSGPSGAPMGSGICDLPACRSGGFPSGGRLMGPGPRGPMPQSLAVSPSLHPCAGPACKPGAGHPGPIVGRTAPMSRSAMNDWRHPCPASMPDCHDHHHHHFHDFIFDYDTTVYNYQPEPDCWRWSRRLQHWVWICGPYPPTAYPY